MKMQLSGILQASIKRLTYIVTRGRLTAAFRAMKLRETIDAKIPGAEKTRKSDVMRATSPETPPNFVQKSVCNNNTQPMMPSKIASQRF